MNVIIAGNPVEGFTIVGPFNGTDNAILWATENEDADWWLAELVAP